MMAMKNRIGEDSTTTRLHNRSGLDLTVYKASIVETSIADLRKRYQRYCVKTMASDALRLSPKLFERITDAVEIYA
jgi:hypothetical protein